MKRSCRAALFAFLAFLVLATAAYAQGSSKTHFLIARPGMPDPNSGKRWSLSPTRKARKQPASSSTAHQPLARRNVAERALQTLQGADILRRAGGASRLVAVFQADKFSGAAVTMLPGLYLAVRADSIDALLNNPPRRSASSRATPMGPGPAAGELDRGDWSVTEAEADAVFLKDTSRLWQTW